MLLNAIVLMLAAWRLTSILNREKIAAPIRQRLGVRTSEHFDVVEDTFIAQAVDCFMCLSVWVSAGVLVVGYICPPLLYPFALSGAVILMESVLEWLDQKSTPVSH